CRIKPRTLPYLGRSEICQVAKMGKVDARTHDTMIKGGFDYDAAKDRYFFVREAVWDVQKRIDKGKKQMGVPARSVEEFLKGEEKMVDELLAAAKAKAEKDKREGKTKPAPAAPAAEAAEEEAPKKKKKASEDDEEDEVAAKKARKAAKKAAEAEEEEE
ncbi:unnamed protein product, partial [Polarella glacialis]